MNETIQQHASNSASPVQSLSPNVMFPLGKKHFPKSRCDLFAQENQTTKYHLLRTNRQNKKIYTLRKSKIT